MHVPVWGCVSVIVRRAPCICSNEYKPWNVNGMQHVEHHKALPWAVDTHTHAHTPHFYCPAIQPLSRCLSVTLRIRPAPSLTPSLCTLLTLYRMYTLYTLHTWTACPVDMKWSAGLTGALWRQDGRLQEGKHVNVDLSVSPSVILKFLIWQQW